MAKKKTTAIRELTMSEITEHCAMSRVMIKYKMKELINAKGKKADGDYVGKTYVPTESQQKSLSYFSNIKVVSVGISDDVSGEIYVEGDNRTYTAFDIIPFETQYNILACLTDFIKI